MTTVAIDVAPPRSASVRVTRVIDETRDAKSFAFTVPDDRCRDFAYRPGQFVTLRIPSDRDGSVARCYSLSSCPATDVELVVTVKRTSRGYGSNWLCDNISEGDVIDILPPAGVFTPASLDDDLLLWGAGSGITPLVSIIKATLASGSGHVALVYANRDADSVIFGDELRDLQTRHPNRLTVIHWLEAERQIPTADQLAELASPYAVRHSFICGPAGFMTIAREALGRIGTPRSHVHAEVFASLSGDPFAARVPEPAADPDAATVEVDADGQTYTIGWPRSQTLLDAMLTRGLDVPFSCREGQCGTCAAVVVEGEVTMADAGVLDDDDLAEGYVLACQSRPKGAFARIRF
ncbi:ferredoxin--NADP reductase [Gordonia sp. Z-3]|uniref:ferredoxin--NADP reductase n=1 Tax=Gordonia sp. Z-3 TaxID=3115408 RepID=UPI002E2E3EAE|nr:ferredoxin--NADP reductase [Gordonia sp. Z-3]MED5800615.1 ferredoxin--NADP reductase [Gordonia sp. Z-3]